MIELQVFRLAQDADDAAFLACEKRFQADFAYQQPGLLRRTTARGSGREFAVIQLWSSEQAADEAHSREAANPLAQEWTSFVDPATLRSARWTELD